MHVLREDEKQDIIYNTRGYIWDERGCTAFVRMHNTNRLYVAWVIILCKIRFLKQWNNLYGRWYGPSHCQHFLFKLRVLCKRSISKPCLIAANYKDKNLQWLLKGVAKKTELSNFKPLVYVSSKKMIYIHFHCSGFKNSNIWFS